MVDYLLDLAPDSKGSHFRKHWDAKLCKEADATIKRIVSNLASVSNAYIAYINSHGQFSERWTQPNQSSASTGATQARSHAKKKPIKVRALLRKLSSDDEDGGPSTSHKPSSKAAVGIQKEAVEPWRPDYDRYLATVEQIPDGMPTVEWWGVSSHYFSFLTIFDDMVSLAERPPL